MKRSLAVVWRDDSAGDGLGFRRCSAFEDEQHVAAGDVEGAEPVVAGHNFKAEQALIEGDCGFEVARMQTRFEDPGDLHRSNLKGIEGMFNDMHSSSKTLWTHFFTFGITRDSLLPLKRFPPPSVGGGRMPSA